MNYLADISRLKALDTETFLIRPGRIAPRIVCGSWAEIQNDKIFGYIGDHNEVVQKFDDYINSDAILVGANLAFDLATIAEHRPDLLPAIFKAIREGRVFDLLIAEALDAIYHGTLGLDPRTGGDLRHPGSRKVTKRYSLEVVSDIRLGRSNAKEHDAWRLSYALLYGIPIDRWPFEARQYPIDDAVNSLEVGLVQVGANGGEPHKNLENLPAQCEFAFAAHLGAAHSLKTSRERTEALSDKVDKQHEEAVARFQKLGWVREDGSENQIAIKKAVAIAYGATGACTRCKGVGTLPNYKRQDCRGEKVKGRFQGCTKSDCKTCGGTGSISVLTGDVTCKGADGGCDGTGFDLDSAPLLPRAEKGGIKADRDALMESGNDDLSDYGEAEFETIRTKYIPYLRSGYDAPLKISPNPLVASGRCSYEGGPIHQFPRDGGVRECVVARPGMVLASTDYAAGELCTLASYTKWIVGYSNMLETINSTQDPGSLHTKLGAQMLGIGFEDMQKRVKEGNKEAKDFRQAAKCSNFGLPGGLGAVTLVVTNRRKNAGKTKYPDGREVAGIRFCVLLDGQERCGVEKITLWRDRPCPPVCKRCVEMAEHVLKKTFFATYPEVREYLTWVSSYVQEHGSVPQISWNEEKGECEVVRTRGGVGFCDAANQGFQGLLADIGKHAFCQMVREAYLGVKDDGSPSPLAGCRFPLFLHDEPLAELIEETAHISGPRIAEIMMASGRKFAPEVYWKAEPALSRFWSKGAEPVYDETGKLILWEPKRKAA